MSIQRYNDFNPLNKDTFEKISKIVNYNKKLFDIVESKEKANIAKAELNIQGFNVEIEETECGFKIYTLLDKKIELKEALKSGMFQKLAWGAYSFVKQSNNYSNGKYNFDDGSIWKVITGEDGKEYLTKEIDDETEEIIRKK